jgi:hypothetical protein
MTVDKTLNPERKAKVPGGINQWNGSRTAFVTTSWGHTGDCNNTFSGYDFTSKKVFPDIAAMLGLDPANLRILSSPYTTTWWDGDSSVLLLITPMEFDEQMQDDKFLPTMAGKITLTPSGPEYTTIASSANEDFYFIPAGNGYSIQSKPYEAQYCFSE